MEEHREPSQPLSCPNCGASSQGGGGCEACAPAAARPVLAVLPPIGGPGRPPEIEPIDLVREYKGPTVARLMNARPERRDLLPGTERSMVAPAAEMPEPPSGRVLRGPGHRRGRTLALLAVVLPWSG